MRPSLVFVLPALLLCACGARPDERPAASATASGSSASTSSARGHGEARKSGRHAELIGRWKSTLPPREARAIVAVRAALSDPPNEAAFEAMTPTEEERVNFKNLLRLRATDPDGPMLAKVRRSLAGYEAIVVDFAEASIGWGTSEGAPPRDPYRVLAEDGDVVSLGVKDEHLDVRFLDKDHISMRTAKRTFLMTRDSALAGDAASPPAAWNGATGRPGRDGSPRADTRGARAVVVPGPGAPPDTGGPRDACTAYADCIDQMPRFSNDGGAMLGSSSTIRNWEKTPDRLRQCARAHEMARAGTLCR